MSLWGEEFEIKPKKVETKKILDKISKPKQVVSKASSEVASKKNSKKNVNQYELIPYISAEVYRILGKYKDNTIVIRDYNQFQDYIDIAISNGSIAIDTETNNSLDPISCKLIGLCIYTPLMKQAYIPVNHINRDGTLLDNQITEKQIKEQLDRLKNTKIIMHNGKFDYQVIKQTCKCILDIYWDTMIAVRILDENELRASLKEQYVDKIDSSQEKYSIEHLFEGVQYEILDPELFALYAATDPKMTYELYLWQLKQFQLPDNEGIFSLFMNVEMPVVQVAAEMELRGVAIDTEYANRLSKKYHQKEDIVDKKIEEELRKYDDIIRDWRKTPEANFHPQSKKPDKNGEFKLLKSKNEQLQNPVSITSPVQLAILLYDVLKVGEIDSKNPRGTGEDILQKINLPLCNLILEKRGLEKLIGTYIDKLPQCVSPVDNRLHAHFNQVGAGTGRFSSSDPNLQNIPSHNKEIRLMFVAGYTDYEINSETNTFAVKKEDEIETNQGFIVAKNLTTDFYIRDLDTNSYFKLVSILDDGQFKQLTVDLSQQM